MQVREFALSHRVYRADLLINWPQKNRNSSLANHVELRHVPYVTCR